MMNRSIIFLTVVFITLQSNAQERTFDKHLNKSSLEILLLKEDSLKEYATYLNTDSLPEDRMVSDSIFTKILVRALQVPHSFYFPFDSVLGISKRYAPDSSFRIFTWTITFDDYYCRQKGAIQLRTSDGKLKLFPLRDVSEFTNNAEDSVRTAKNWIGATYYNIIKTTYQNKPYYTLFGIDPNNAMSTMKWMEVLHFNEKGEPLFGGPFFSYERDSVPQPAKYRIHLEYKKDARVLMDFIPDLDMILVDHLISENDDPKNLWTYVPDGDQEGFKWENGQWIHINKVFTLKLQDGQAPLEKPIKEQGFPSKIPPRKN
jgi:hypothetical protein